jgi:beta-lactamase regulating signal transducer with metallopeptidase domain
MNQLFTFMVDWSMKSVFTVALGLAWVLLLRRRSAATRHLIWRITIAAIALLPLAMALTSKAGAPAVMEPIQAPVRAMVLHLEPPRAQHAYLNQRFASMAEEADAMGSNEEQIAGLVYAIGLLGMLAFWVTGWVKIRRIVKTAAPAAEVSSSHRVLVATDPELRVPITFGLIRPVILLPKESEEWPDQRVLAAILHESGHIARKDWAWQTASHLMRALQWFNPAVWVMNGMLQSTSETATDDEVLMQFAMGASTYAGELLKVAEAASGNLHEAMAMARPGGVASRLRRIVAEGIDRARPRRRFSVGLGLAFLVAAVLLAGGTVAGAAGGVAAKTTSLLSKTDAASPQIGDVAYEAKLSHGGVVRMVALSGLADPNGPLWRPDGGPASQAARTLLRPVLGLGAGGDPPKERLVNFYLQVSKLPMKRGETENGIFRIVSPDGWQYRAGSNSFSNDGRLQWDQWSVPAAARSCDMDCAVSYGPYKVIGRGTFGDGKFEAKIGEPTGEQVSVTLHLPGKFGDNQAKLECYDQDGNLVPGGGEALWGNDHGKNVQEFEFDYQAKDAKRIQSFEFSTRNYEHVLIRGIQLPPTGVHA